MTSRSRANHPNDPKIMWDTIDLTQDVLLYTIITAHENLNSTLWCNEEKQLLIGDYMQYHCVPTCKDYILTFFNKEDALIYIKHLIKKNYNVDANNCFLIPISVGKLFEYDSSIFKYSKYSKKVVYNFSDCGDIIHFLEPNQRSLVKKFPCCVFAISLPSTVFASNKRDILSSNLQWVKFDLRVYKNGTYSYKLPTSTKSIYWAFSRYICCCLLFLEDFV